MQDPLAPLLRADTPTLSFEFFPPKTPAGEQQFARTLTEVAQLQPDFVSVTFGAGGGQAQRIEASLRVLRQVVETTGVKVVAHLTCVGLSVDDLRRAVGSFGQLGISTMLALRGDPPPGNAFETWPGGLSHADELVRLVRQEGPYDVGVAVSPYGHPEAVSLECDVAVLRAKQQAGASFAITQMFFDPQVYADLLDRARAAGVTMPIIAGLMPPTRVGQLDRLEGFSGAPLPPGLLAALQGCQDDQAVCAAGLEWMVDLGRRVLDLGAPGLHLYTLNRSTVTLDMARRLGLRP